MAALKLGIKRDLHDRVPSFADRNAGSGVYTVGVESVVQRSNSSCAAPVLDGWNRMGDTVSLASSESSDAVNFALSPQNRAVLGRSLSYARFFDSPMG